MKKIKLFLLLTVLVSLFSGCMKATNESNLSSVEVKLQVPTGYENSNLSDIEISLTNSSDNSIRTAKTNSTGVAIFSDIPAGKYNIAGVLKYSPSLTLNAIVNDYVVAQKSSLTLPIVMKIASASDDFVIKEIFYLGKADYDQKDRFFELFNNSSRVLYADNLHFADLAGKTGSDANDNVLGLPLTDYVYGVNVAMLPGTGSQYPINPGESIIIAFNAINFKEGFNPTNWAGLKIEDYMDLSKANFEMFAIPFLENKGFTGNTYFDIDNPSVPNIEILYMTNAANNAWFNLNAYGPALVIFRPETTLDLTNTVEDPSSKAPSLRYFLKIPVASIIDGIDILSNSSAAKFRRLPDIIDMSFTYPKADGNANYSNLSIRRKIDVVDGSRKILKDTNNSSADFEVITRPTPGTF